jgi:hypothetical protein
MHKIAKIFVAAALIGLLPACANVEGRYPSLALRPFERGEAPVVAPGPIRLAVPPALDPATLARLRERAAAAHAVFLGQESQTAPIARSGAGLGVESKPRAAALIAMADLTSKRHATAAVLADLDLLAATGATNLTQDPALIAAQAEVAALVAREDAAMARLWEILGP